MPSHSMEISLTGRAGMSVQAAMAHIFTAIAHDEITRILNTLMLLSLRAIWRFAMEVKI